MSLEPLIYGLFGLIIGSFLNVCIYRIPLGKSVVFPGSSCPQCGKAIRAYDNIPVLSYIILRGKCRFCGKPISIQYPLVELLTGLSFYFCGRIWYLTSPAFVNTLFLCVVIILVFTDFHHRILPNVLTIPGIIAGVLLSLFQTPSFYSDTLSVRTALSLSENPQSVLPWVGSIFGAVIGGGILLLVGVGYLKLRKKEGLGMGDVKMMAFVGAFLGWRLALLTIFSGAVLGTLISIPFMLSGKMNLQSKLAFGVFLGIGAAFSLFFGLPVLDWYLKFFR